MYSPYFDVHLGGTRSVPQARFSRCVVRAELGYCIPRLRSVGAKSVPTSLKFQGDLDLST